MKTPGGMAPDRLAEVLTAAGKTPVTAGMIEADLAAGAPANPDGTLNLIRYAAWLLKQDRNGQD